MFAWGDSVGMRGALSRASLPRSIMGLFLYNLFSFAAGTHSRGYVQTSRSQKGACTSTAIPASIVLKAWYNWQA